MELLNLDSDSGAVDLLVMVIRPNTKSDWRENFVSFWYRLVFGKKSKMNIVEILNVSASSFKKHWSGSAY